MNKFNRAKITKLIAAGLIALGIGFLQKDIANVAAEVSSYLVRFPEQLDFGIVFPEEQLSRNYEISFSNELPSTELSFDYVESKKVGTSYVETITITQGNAISYEIYEAPKELPSGYEGDGEDPNNPGFYRDLCDHITSTSLESEGDVLSSAFMSADDTADSWRVDLLVPPIEGYVPQNEIGSVLTVPDSGDFGCDLTVEELPQTTTLTVDLPLNCVNLSSASPDPYSYDSTSGVLTWTFNDLFYGGTERVTVTVDATDVCPEATTLVSYNDSYTDTSDSMVEDIDEEEQDEDEDDATADTVGGTTLAATVEIEDPGIGGGQVLGMAVTGAESWRLALVGVCLITAGILLKPRWLQKKTA